MKEDIRPERFFPTEVDPRELIFSFQLFLKIIQTFSDFGNNFHYGFEQGTINMQFDLLNGGTLGLYINRKARETFAVIQNEEGEQIQQITEITQLNLGSDKKTLLFTSSNGTLHTVDQQGSVTTSNSSNTESKPVTFSTRKTGLERVVDAMGRARETEEQLADTKNYDPRATIERIMSLDEANRIFADAKLGVDSVFVEVETTPVLPLLENDPTEETTKEADNTIKLKSGEVVGPEPQIKGGWHLPAPKPSPKSALTEAIN